MSMCSERQVHISLPCSVQYQSMSSRLTIDLPCDTHLAYNVEQLSNGDQLACNEISEVELE